VECSCRSRVGGGTSLLGPKKRGRNAAMDPLAGKARKKKKSILALSTRPQRRRRKKKGEVILLHSREEERGKERKKSSWRGGRKESVGEVAFRLRWKERNGAPHM